MVNKTRSTFMSYRRRGTAAVALAVAAALSLAACGADSSGKDGGSSSQGSKDSKSVAKGGKDFGDAAAKTAALGTDAKPGQWPRTVKHAMGSTEIKEQPKRV